MRVAGIIAEYDPFHLGHAYHIRKTREEGADAVCVVMSGDCVQRGFPALFSKFDRAEAAVRNGADLVLELPVQYAVSGAPVFAEYAVRMLSELGEGVISMLSFGSETGNLTLLRRAADKLEELSDSEEVRLLMSQGMGYAKAVSTATGKAGEVLQNPNDMLAAEYIRAAKKYMPNIRLLAVERLGASHNSSEADEHSISASLIREKFPDPSVLKYIPDEFHTLVPTDYKRFDEFVYINTVLSANSEHLLQLPDGDEALASRVGSVIGTSVKNNLYLPVSQEFAKAIASKSLSYSKVRRILLGLLLGLRKSDIDGIPFGRILAINKTGTRILAEVKKKNGLYCRTSLSELRKQSDFAQRSAELMIQASRIQQIFSCGRIVSNEYTRKITVMK